MRVDWPGWKPVEPIAEGRPFGQVAEALMTVGGDRR
jgi:hypothetical protein